MEVKADVRNKVVYGAEMKCNASELLLLIQVLRCYAEDYVHHPADRLVATVWGQMILNELNRENEKNKGSGH